MSTPTLSMRLFGDRGRAARLKMERSKAAKRAWITRRRMAKITPTMRKVLEVLASKDGARLSLHYHGRMVYGVGLVGVNQDGSTFSVYHPSRYGRLPVTLTTFKALNKRKLLEPAGTRESGGTLGTLPDGTYGIVVRSFDVLYRITPKGRKALEPQDSTSEPPKPS